MEQPPPDSIKHRDIEFRDPHPDPRQAHSAVLVLSDVEGVVYACVPNPTRNVLHIRYDLSLICLRDVEDLLSELGFHLDNSLISQLRRALYYYTEENQIDNQIVHRDQDHSTRDIFMRCYRCKTHGCRDERPEYWRQYL